ncbi:MAG TPA: response regulator [Spirochaetota bacterium]|nr:response regulator [Spirochaetota bacterium]
MSTTKILIVEDESIIALDIKSILSRLGYSVTAIVISGPECLKQISENRPDLILMDIKLKGSMDGIETANIVLKEYNIPIVFITAHSDKSSLQRAKVTKPYGYIVKPVSERELYTTIETSIYRHTIDKKLKDSETKYRTLFEQSRDAIYLCDIDGNITTVNQSLLNLFKITEDTIANKNISSLFVNRDDWFELSNILIAKGYVVDYETAMLKNDGTIITALITSTKMYSDNNTISGYQGIIRDDTERIETLNELIKSREELRSLSDYLLTLRETERTNIAREIHDVLGQSLTALKMDLFWIAKRLDKGEKELLEKTGTMSDLINGIIETVRRISSDLRPGILDDLGLFPAIEWQSDEFSKRTGIECSVDCNINGMDIDEKISVALFRIFQESLTNIMRHAQATKVNISLKHFNNTLELSVNDNGRGIRQEEIRNSRSFGLIGIRERAFSCGGDVVISGGTPGGTEVKVTIPLEQEN